MPLTINLANNLSTIRTARKMSLTDFADELCISRSCLQTILSGNSNLRISTINQIASRLNTNALDLLQEPNSTDQLSHTLLILDSLDVYQRLSKEDRLQADELFHQLIMILDRTPVK